MQKTSRWVDFHEITLYFKLWFCHQNIVPKHSVPCSPDYMVPGEENEILNWLVLNISSLPYSTNKQFIEPVMPMKSLAEGRSSANKSLPQFISQTFPRRRSTW